MKKMVIITDGEQRSALAVVRSLGRAGYRCVVTESAPASIAGSSRYCARRVVVPDALTEPLQFGRVIEALCAEENAAVLIPIAEASMLALLPLRESLAPTTIPFPDTSSFAAISDKQRVLGEAARLGISVPKSVAVNDRASLAGVGLVQLEYPVVIKPARSVSGGEGERIKLGVSYAENLDELRQKLGALPDAAFPVLLQQRIVGPGTGIFLLMWDGITRARFAHRRISEKPPNGGVSVYCESVAVEASLIAASEKLLGQFGWQGVAMVEYKRDARTGVPYLMEVNGRFWGSLQLAVNAGVDFPRLLVECALGAPPQSESSYHIGVRGRWWWGQVDHVINRVRRRTHSAPGIVSLSRACTDLFMAPFRQRDYEDVLSWDDPRPFWNETMRWIGAR
jgi:predicted ATP-grasp superfamily ATP-dependent carboligase